MQCSFYTLGEGDVMKMNPTQMKAIMHDTGPMMVIAGPGSGKTAVLTRRIQYLIEVIGADPSKILVITFTRAAAEEMKERFLGLIHDSSTAVQFGTFHSIFYSILQQQSEQKLRLIEMPEAVKIMCAYLNTILEYDYEEAWWRAFFILSENSRLLNTGTYDVEKMNRIVGDAVFRDAINYYREYKVRKQCIDFDDMLIRMKQLLEQNVLVLKECQEQYQYILVDEFQDINRVQYEILNKIALKHRNLFVVGDDDQAIYRFRGSQPEYLLQFRKQYPEAERVDLTVNYRSHKEIVEAAKVFIEYNKNRYSKEFQSSKGCGGRIRLYKMQDEIREMEAVCSCIQEYSKFMKYEEMAILYRTHIQSQVLRQALLTWGIPFQCNEAVYNPLESDIAKDIAAYLHLAVDINIEDLSRIWKKPNRKIPEYFIVDRLQCRDARMNVNEQCEIEELRYHLKKLKKKIERQEIKEAMIYIWNAIGYERYLKEHCEKQGISWKMARNHFIWLLDYVEKGAYTKGEPFLKGVHLSTMHGAKGLEYKAVLIIDVNEGICPYEYAETNEALEEERRIFYVAMTRAKEYLDLFYTTKGSRRLRPSVYINDLKN